MEHATPKLDVAETKPDGNDILNKLRAPPVVADEAKLAIIFSFFFLLFLLSTTIVFHPLRGNSCA